MPQTPRILMEGVLYRDSLGHKPDHYSPAQWAAMVKQAKIAHHIIEETKLLEKQCTCFT